LQLFDLAFLAGREAQPVTEILQVERLVQLGVLAVDAPNRVPEIINRHTALFAGMQVTLRELPRP